MSAENLRIAILHKDKVAGIRAEVEWESGKEVELLEILDELREEVIGRALRRLPR